ncbi:hypothetical protein FO408_19195 [Salmonella enterica subsp. enterica]|nr:hypothetical protein [Salmonella enterica subsp. enterica]
MNPLGVVLNMPEMCIPFHLIQMKKRGRPPCHQARYRSFARITLAKV